jgi:hypothetical protein
VTVETVHCNFCGAERILFRSPEPVPDDDVDWDDGGPSDGNAFSGFLLAELLDGWESWVDGLAEMNERHADRANGTWNPHDYSGLLGWREIVDSVPEGDWTQEQRDRLYEIDAHFRGLTTPDSDVLFRMHVTGHHELPDVWYTNRIPIAG